MVPEKQECQRWGGHWTPHREVSWRLGREWTGWWPCFAQPWYLILRGPCCSDSMSLGVWSLVIPFLLYLPSSPWQISVLVAPPRMNSGFSTISWRSESILGKDPKHNSHSREKGSPCPPGRKILMEGQEGAKAARDLCSDLPGLSLVHPQLSPGDSLAPAPFSIETHTI